MTEMLLLMLCGTLKQVFFTSCMLLIQLCLVSGGTFCSHYDHFSLREEIFHLFIYFIHLNREPLQI